MNSIGPIDEIASKRPYLADGRSTAQTWRKTDFPTENQFQFLLSTYRSAVVDCSVNASAADLQLPENTGLLIKCLQRKKPALRPVLGSSGDRI